MQDRVEFAVQIGVGAGVGVGAGAIAPPLTLKEALADFPSNVPVILAVPFVLPAAKVNVLLVAPEATVEETGTLATAVLLLLSVTIHPAVYLQPSVK